MGKLFGKSCREMMEELSKVKRDAEREMVVFQRLFARDVKKLVEGEVTRR